MRENSKSAIGDPGEADGRPAPDTFPGADTRRPAWGSPGIRLDAVLAAARVGAASLPAELCGYIALSASDHLVGAPRLLGPGDVQLEENGAVRAVRGEATDDAAAAASLRQLLSRMLSVAPSVPPALRRASARTENGGVEALRMELEAALVPVNRAAAQRALARMCREALRALRAGIVSSGAEEKGVDARRPVPVAESASADATPQAVAPESSTLPWVRPKAAACPDPADDGAVSTRLGHESSRPAAGGCPVPRTEPASTGPEGSQTLDARRAAPEGADSPTVLGPGGLEPESDQTEPMSMGTEIGPDDDPLPSLPVRAADLQITKRLPLGRRVKGRCSLPQTASRQRAHQGDSRSVNRTPPLGTALPWLRPPPPTALAIASGLAGGANTVAAPVVHETGGGDERDLGRRMEIDTQVVRCSVGQTDDRSAPGPKIGPLPPARSETTARSSKPRSRSAMGEPDPASESGNADGMPGRAEAPKSDLRALVEGFSAEDTRSEQELCLELRRIAGMKQA